MPIGWLGLAAVLGRVPDVAFHTGKVRCGAHKTFYKTVEKKMK